jgi:hypothetical protein
MRCYVIAILPALILGTSAYAAEKVNGQNRDYQTLSEVSSVVPGHPEQTIKQYSTTFKIINASNPMLNGTSLEVGQQEINGTNNNIHGYGTTLSSNGSDQTYWSFSGAFQVNGQDMNGSGTFQWTGGTGKFKNIKGGGQFACEFGPKAKNGCDWSGQPEGLESM